MQIDHHISSYIVISEESILSALQKISKNKNKIVFSVDESGILKGVVTDGDFRRWLLRQQDIDLSVPVSLVHNTTFNYAPIGDSISNLKTLITKNISIIPLVDNNLRLVAIAKKITSGVRIGNIEIGENTPAFIIAEIGNNHNGSYDLAIKMVDEAIAAGADCVKFQMREMNELYRNFGNTDDNKEDLGSQYTLDLLSRNQLKIDEMLEVFEYCREKKIMPLCTPWDKKSLDRLEQYGMDAYKIASADLTNHDLIQHAMKSGKPLICSTGMTTEEEIIKAVSLLKQSNIPFVLLHCNSTYPAPFKDINLSYISRLKEISGDIVGYSGHERGYSVVLAAISMGAKIIEKHFTLDRTMEGNDHKVSLLPQEFSDMVQGIREVEEALGNERKRQLTQGEMINREVLGKSLTIACDLNKGEEITESVIKVKSPGQGLPAYRKVDLIGKKALRNFKSGDFFFPSDIGESIVRPRKYVFKRPWGVPVRYHDYFNLIQSTNPDFVEFHLSYKDLEIDIDTIFKKETNLYFLVHSPELFKGDHVLDLCSDDLQYRKRSIDELQRIINLANNLKKYFINSKLPLIVVNAGGFSQNSFINKEKKSELYDSTLDSLNSLDTSGVELILQTMPPYPWHFGGQRYHNIFISADEIVEFCKKSGYRICFDVSHSFLACNQFKWSFKEFVEKVGPYSAHLHIADAMGTNDEGLQIGKGEIDFPALDDWLSKSCPDISFIPEIWQGHKNDGEGFWKAMDRLEKVLK